MNRKAIIISIIAILLSISVISTVIFWYSSKSETAESLIYPESTQIYGIIFDAGSTGTRIHVFEFERNGTELILKKELFKELKPGLSSLSPQDTKDQIEQLLSHAENFIPKEFWMETPLKLKATAGLRLLEPSRSQEILDAVRDVFRTSKFVTSENAVEIIDGNSEGIYGWFSMNYLKHLLTSSHKVTALDLGGASTQVTFEVNEELPENLQSFVHKVKNFGGESQVFVKSYLGLGLMALRHAVIIKDSPVDQLNVNSDCINSAFDPFNWKYQDLTYKISPKSTDNSTFDDCVIAIRKIVSEVMKPKAPNLQNQTINAFSYFFDRSVDAGLIKADIENGEVDVQQFRQKAIEYCEEQKGTDPWLCLDMTYISVLLQDGYGLEDDKTVMIFSRINGHEASWSLGSFLQDYISRPRRV